MAHKNTFVAYFLWLIGGIFGIHHFYLGRYCHGIVWSLSLGGFFVGLISDIYNIPSYVKYANDEYKYMKRLQAMFTLKKPSVSYSRLMLSFYVSFYLSLLMYAPFTKYFPSEIYFNNYLKVLMVFTTSFGVYVVCNIGFKCTSYVYIALLSVVVMFSTNSLASSLITQCCVLNTLIVNHFLVSWDSKEFVAYKQNRMRIFMAIFYPVHLFCFLEFFLVIMYKLDFMDKNYTLLEFYYSDYWIATIDTLWNLWLTVFSDKWTVDKFRISLNQSKFDYALKLFKIDSEFSMDTLKKSYRNLLKIHHPDKNNSQEDEKFLEIQKYYEFLRNFYKNRIEL